MEANALVQSVMDQYPSIQAQIVGYTDQGVAEILLFVTIAPQVRTTEKIFFYKLFDWLTNKQNNRSGIHKRNKSTISALVALISLKQAI